MSKAYFSDLKQSILQVRVIDIASGSKSAIGSGFVVDSNGLVATNYHVVEQKVSKPDKFRVQYLTSMNQKVNCIWLMWMLSMIWLCSRQRTFSCLLLK